MELLQIVSDRLLRLKMFEEAKTLNVIRERLDEGALKEEAERVVTNDESEKV